MKLVLERVDLTLVLLEIANFLGCEEGYPTLRDYMDYSIIASTAPSEDV